MRYVPILIAALTLSAPALAQSPASGMTDPASGGPAVRQTAAGASHPAAGPSKAAADFDRRFIEDEKRIERIMTICNGC